jgi:hypothetical protein
MPRARAMQISADGDFDALWSKLLECESKHNPAAVRTDESGDSF